MNYSLIVINLIKYHVEKNESSFRNEAINIARYFDSIGDDQLTEYIMSLIAEANSYSPQMSDFEGEYVKQDKAMGINYIKMAFQNGYPKAYEYWTEQQMWKYEK